MAPRAPYKRPSLTEAQKAELKAAKAKLGSGFAGTVEAQIKKDPSVFFTASNEGRIHVVLKNGSEHTITVK